MTTLYNLHHIQKYDENQRHLHTKTAQKRRVGDVSIGDSVTHRSRFFAWLRQYAASKPFLLVGCTLLVLSHLAPAYGATGQNPVEPAVSPRGSDVSTLPAEYPAASWMPLLSPLLSPTLVVHADVNGKKMPAYVDTGAMLTTMSIPVAIKLGVLTEDTAEGEKIRVYDAHGNLLEGERLPVGKISIGAHTWTNCSAIVVGDSPDLFLLGADLLQDVDLLIAAEEGLLGVFDAGQAPRLPSDRVAHVERRGKQLIAKASAMPALDDAPLQAGKPIQVPRAVPFSLVVDTGAAETSLPVLVGVEGKLPISLAYENTTTAVGGAQTTRGRFILDPLYVGDPAIPVGKVVAMGSTIDNGTGFGLLGNDVLMRQRTVVSFRNQEIRFQEKTARPSVRWRGPAGQRCYEDANDPKSAPRPCIGVSLAPVAPERRSSELADLCVQIDVDRSYQSKTLEVLIGVEDDKQQPLINGMLRAFITVGPEGAQPCFALWRQLKTMGLHESAQISLRWVRTEGMEWPCNPMKTHCILFTGSLPRLDL